MSLIQDIAALALRRRGVIMSADPNDPNDIEGVLNPGACIGRDRGLLIYPRHVAAGNISRIGVAKVILSPTGLPQSVHRLGYALEPTESYEQRPLPDGSIGGGVEDARVTFVPALDTFLMTYVAFGPQGPRIALAKSYDAKYWRRLGLVQFDTSVFYGDQDINNTDNKDALIFPEPVLDPSGVLSIAMLHRPTFAKWSNGLPRKPAIWISYVPLEAVRARLKNILTWSGHRVVAESSDQPWEALKIGGGPPPVRTKDGWLLFYHGVSGHIATGVEQQQSVYYQTGAMILDHADPAKVLYRTDQPVLSPETAEERHGTVPNVVFPTGLVSVPQGHIIFYGMGDSAIGVATDF